MALVINLIRDVAQKIRPCPRETMLNAYVRAARQFCGETRWYRANLDAEMLVPREVLQRRVSGTRVQHLAYPFGDANMAVLESAARHGYELGLTVVPGPNAFYAQPMLLRRTMIFGDLDLEGFKIKLQTQRSLTAP